MGGAGETVIEICASVNGCICELRGQMPVGSLDLPLTRELSDRQTLNSGMYFSQLKDCKVRGKKSESQ